MLKNRSYNSASGKTVKPYLPSYQSPASRFIKSGRSGSVTSEDDSYSFSSLKSRSSISRSIASGSTDLFGSRRSISYRAEMALNYDNFGTERYRAGGGGAGAVEYEKSPTISPMMYNSPAMGDAEFLARRSRVVDKYEIPHWSPDDDNEEKIRPIEWIKPLVKPMVEFVDSIKEQNGRKRQNEQDLIRRLAVKFQEVEDTETKRVERKTQIDMLGKNGVVLFFPLLAGLEAWDDINDDGDNDEMVDTDHDSVTGADPEDMDQSRHNVEVVKEPDEDISENPYILSQSMMNELAENGIPVAISLRKWKRLYSLTRDGDSINAMLYLVEPYRYTLMVIKTTKGEIFGAYAHDKWEDKGCQSTIFYGSGQTFLFSVHVEVPCSNEDKEEESESHSRVDIYKWKGTNSYFQMCSASNDRIALGGGSSCFGLCVEDSFRFGSTGYCNTFGNPPLCRDGQFEILNVEVYGFITSGYHDGV